VVLVLSCPSAGPGQGRASARELPWLTLNRRGVWHDQATRDHACACGPDHLIPSTRAVRGAKGVIARFVPAAARPPVIRHRPCVLDEQGAILPGAVLGVAECWCARTIEEALAREAHMLVTKPIRNREAPVTEPQLG
jgi:hypothetical protein